MAEALIVVLPRVRLAVAFNEKLAPSISTVALPPLPQVYGLAGGFTVKLPIAVAVSVNAAVAALPETL